MEPRALLPATAELTERIGWFIRLRWVAVLGVTLFVLGGPRILPLTLHLSPIFTTLALLALYNGVATAYFRARVVRAGISALAGSGEGVGDPSRGAAGPDEDLATPDQRPASPRLARWLLPRTLRVMGYGPTVIRSVYFVNLQMLLDLFFLVILIHFTGGIENPLRMFFLFHVIISAILLSRRATYFYATAALLLMAGMTLGEMTGWLAHYGLSAHWREGAYADPHLAGAQLFLLGTTLYITAYIGSSIGARLRARELDVVLLTGAVEEKAAHLEAAYEELSRAERAKSQYMRKVAHELRGPLGTIQTALGVALQKASGASATTSLDLIRRAWSRAGELAELTRELLTLSRARDGRALAEAVPLRPGEVAARVLEEMRDRARDGGVELRVEVPPELPEMTADPEGLSDLLTNLLANAIRYTPSGGSVTFSMTEEGPNLEVRVSDTGIGIEAGALNRIFEEFYRSEAARAFAPEGTGLGMAIVKAVVDQHRGDVKVESEEGRGTRVRVQIPLSPGE